MRPNGRIYATLFPLPHHRSSTLPAHITPRAPSRHCRRTWDTGDLRLSAVRRRLASSGVRSGCRRTAGVGLDTSVAAWLLVCALDSRRTLAYSFRRIQSGPVGCFCLIFHAPWCGSARGCRLRWVTGSANTVRASWPIFCFASWRVRWQSALQPPHCIADCRIRKPNRIRALDCARI